MNLQNAEQARYHMIEQQVRPWQVLDAQVLELLSTLKREDFVQPEQKALAFADYELSTVAGQTMLTPRVQARLVQDAAAKPTDKVLLIGAGTGFMAAMLARMAQRVIGLEINAELADMARANLQTAGIHNVEVRQADGAAGLAGDAPFDVIVLGGSVAEVPAALLNQLKVGGRLVGIVGNEPIMHGLTITRTSDTNFTTTENWDDNAPRLQHFPQPNTFKF